MALTSQQQAFIDKLMPAAIEASKRTGVDPRVIVAQAAQETGWGRSAPNNNYFGIKSHGKSGGTSLPTHEIINGKRVSLNQSFRGYNSPSDSVSGYADFINKNPRYTSFRGAKDLQSQLDELQKSGYATDPNYSRSVGSIARSIPLNPALQAIEQTAPRPLDAPSRLALAPQRAAPRQQPGRKAGGIMSGLFDVGKNLGDSFNRVTSDPAFRRRVAMNHVFGTSLMPPRQKTARARGRGELLRYSPPATQFSTSRGEHSTPVTSVSNKGSSSGFLTRSDGQLGGETRGNMNMDVYRANRAAVGGVINQASIDKALSSGKTLYRL